MALPRSLVRNGWQPWHFAAAMGLAAIAVAATLRVWADILHVAVRDPEASHVLLVPFIAGWLAFIRRRRLRLCLPRGQWCGAALIFVGWLMLIFGGRLEGQMIWHLSAVIILVGSAIAVLGRDVLVQFLPAIGALAFLAPLPAATRQALSIPLQQMTAEITASVYDVAGLAAERHGNLLTVSGVDVRVAEACNGLRMVSAMVLFAYAFAFCMPLRMPVRILVVLISPLVALACNTLRLIGTLWMYGPYSEALAQSVHAYSGWLMLLLAILLLTGLIQLLVWASVPVRYYSLAYDY